MGNKYISGLLIAGLSLSAVAGKTSKKEEFMNERKQMVKELLKSIETGDARPVGYINPGKYIQHRSLVQRIIGACRQLYFYNG